MLPDLCLCVLPGLVAMEELPQAKLKPITPFVRERKDELPGGLKLFPLVKKKKKKGYLAILIKQSSRVFLYRSTQAHSLTSGSPLPEL